MLDTRITLAGLWISVMLVYLLDLTEFAAFADEFHDLFFG